MYRLLDKTRTTSLGRAVMVVGLSAFALPAFSELQALDDRDLSNVTGQAYIAIDQYSHPAAQDSTTYTRINLGMDIEIQTNIDTLELGRYDRHDPYGKQMPADVMIDNFSLGYIYNDRYFSDNPDTARPLKDDGSSYQNGEIVPFKIKDPFIEFAFDDATNEIKGARIGFGESMGMLSGDVQALTGNVDVDILDRGEGMRAASSSGNLADRLLVLLTPLLEGSSPIQTQAILVDDQGNPDPIRATMIGVENGEKFTLSGASGFTRWSVKNLLGGFSSSEIEVPGCSFWSCPGGDILIYTQDCKVLGVQACFNLEQFESFPIGKVEEIGGKRYLTAPSSGMFMSFQTESMGWLKDVRNANPTAADFVQATSGAFFNIPNGTVQVNLNEALNGVPGLRREYIDRGNGLF